MGQNDAAMRNMAQKGSCHQCIISTEHQMACFHKSVGGVLLSLWK